MNEPAFKKPMAELSDGELLRCKCINAHETRKSEGLPVANILSFENIERESIKWLWHGKIPLRKLSIIVGDPGISKSLFSCDLAGRVTTGFPFADGVAPEIGDVIFMTLEDDPGDTIRPRLEAAKADLSRCHFLKGKTITKQDGIEKNRELILSDIEILRDALNQIRGKNGNPTVLIIDPLDSYLGGADSNSNEVRELLTPIGEFSRSENIAVIGIKHLNKAAQKSPAYRVGGSIGFTAVARAVWCITKDPDEDGKRLFLPLKNNLGKDAAGMSYYISEDQTETPFLDWNREPENRDLNQVLSGCNYEKPISVEREEIIDYLAEHGKAKTGDIAEAIGKSKQSTSNMLQKLYRAGKVIKTSHGVYAITSVHPPHVSDVNDVNGVNDGQNTSVTPNTSDTLGGSTDVNDQNPGKSEDPPEFEIF